MKKLKLSPPWVSFANELKALFAGDQEIKVIADHEENVISLYVDNADKAEALASILPEKKTFGNVSVSVTVVPSNKPGDKYRDQMKTAFAGNPALVDVLTIASPLGTFTYAVWAREVVQFFDDNLADPHGLRSTLFEDIARDVFKNDLNVFHCTDAGLNAPLGEWP